MKHRIRPKRSVWLTLAVFAIFTGLTAGCQFQQSIADGFFRGITDSVAAVVTNALLTAAEQTPPG